LSRELPSMWILVALIVLPLLTVVPVVLSSNRTEYEEHIRTLPSELFEGGCVNPGSNLDTKEQKAIHKRLTSTYSWPIVTGEAVDRMAEFIGEDGVVDFGAGNGYLSYLLDKRGIKVRAIDNWIEGKPDNMWFPVETGSPHNLAGTSDKVLLLSWPTRDSDMGIYALQVWGGEKLIYAGEILRGTANFAFHKELGADWHLVEEIDIPNWRNRSDAIYLLERRPGNGDGFEWLQAIVSECTFD
jgi:hypothetical protein